MMILVVLSILAYLLPSVIATLRGHHNGMSIFVINLLLGWTFLGWVVSLAMAFSKVEKA
jgi:hypothetical protein